jgi:SAM-dependent methyltransferase
MAAINTSAPDGSGSDRQKWATMEVAQILTSDEYVRHRLQPRPGDPDYLCLIDLLNAVRDMAPLEAPRVLDYGCGGSPYRSLFTGAVYHRADLAGGADLDFPFTSDSRLPPEVGNYDLVLSSQVLEHVLDPALYLSECFRVLKPGGKLLVTTHGTFWDHACPHDYWRWTAFGLRKAVENAGFGVLEAKKITTGIRAALYLLEQNLDPRILGTGLYGIVSTYFLRLDCKSGSECRHQMADVSLKDYTVVEAQGVGETPDHALYIGVAVLAQKPRN